MSIFVCLIRVFLCFCFHWKRMRQICVIVEELWLVFFGAVPCTFSLWVSPFLTDFSRAVAARPITYAAVLRMKSDGASSLLSSRSRPRQQHDGGLLTPDWPGFSSHPLSALSLLGTQEDNRSEGGVTLTASLCPYRNACIEQIVTLHRNLIPLT